MEDTKQLSFRLPHATIKRLKQACLDRSIESQTDAVREAIESWLVSPAAAPVLKPPLVAEPRSTPYRKENLPWHDRLERVLNDPEEALGIQKNLEWADRTVSQKQQRPAAGRRVGGK